MTDSREWTPEQHIERACELVNVVENHDGHGDRYDLTIALAHLHVALGRAKDVIRGD